MHIFIPGGAGSIGCILIPSLIEMGHEVTVYDLFLQGEETFKHLTNHPNLTLVKGDVQDTKRIEFALNGCEIILYLAPLRDLSKVESFEAFVKIAKKKIASRFIVTVNKGENASEHPLINHHGKNLSCAIVRLGKAHGEPPTEEDLNKIYLQFPQKPSEEPPEKVSTLRYSSSKACFP